MINELKPYPGLRPFEYTENYLFFGREGKAQEIASRLQRSHFVAVVGTSGSGKSSLVRAGLLPLLYGGMLYESGSRWRIALMRPEETPIRNLAEALVCPADFEIDGKSGKTKDETEIAITEITLRRSGVGLIDFINNPANSFAEDENLLVVVDQFEEIFRFKGKAGLEDTDEAIAFVKLLIEATRDKTSRIYVVITMRSDFLGDCAEFQNLPEAINEGQYLIPRLTRDQLRQLIESPAMVCDASVSPVLVNRLLSDIDDDQNQTADVRERMLRDHLPVLQHALMRTWEVWKTQNTPDLPLEIEHYENEKIGGMAFALSRHADEAFAELTPREQFIAEKMFKCLTETDNESRQIRRPARIEEICAVAGAEKEEVFKVADVFRREGRTFLMPPPAVSLTGETMIDISHESLIRNWKKLREWVEIEADDAWQFRRLAEDTRLMEEYKNENEGILSGDEIEQNSKDFLWRGIELKDAVKWRKNFVPNPAWAARYQILTDREKRELEEFSRSAPAEEPRVRQEIMRLNFEKVLAFLDKSEKNEAEIMAEREKAQQERVAREREKAEAAEQLAKVEREKNDSLKRQQRILIAVSAFSILLMLAATGAAIIAWRFYQSATAAQAEAEKQKDIAEANSIEATKQRAIAIDERENAEKQKNIAQAEKENAETQKNEAEKQANRAKIEKANAEKQTKIANAEKANAERQEQIALDAKADLQKSFDNLDEAKKNLEDSIAKSDFNLAGLTAFENYDYETAHKNFGALEKKEGLKKTEIWWAKYNIAKSHEQLGDFAKSEFYYKDALNSLPPFEISTTDNINARVKFLTASFNTRQDDHEAALLKSFRVITLRKFAQFYRNCALNQEDCFEDFEESERKSAYSKADADKLPKTDAAGLNEASARFYKEIIQYKEYIVANRAFGAGNEEKERIFLADVKTELADIYLDLNRNPEAEANYMNALTEYASLGKAKYLTDISTRMKLLEAKLRISGMEKLDEADEQAKVILEKKKGFLAKYDDLESVALDIRMGSTYTELAQIYKKYSQRAIEIYRWRLRTEKAKFNKNTDKQAVEANAKTKQAVASQKEPGVETDEGKFIEFLETAFGGRNTLEELEAIWRSANPNSNINPAWLKEFFGKVSDDFNAYKRLDQKADIFSSIAAGIKNINENKDAEDDLYEALLIGYLSNNEPEKAAEVLISYNNFIKTEVVKDKRLVSKRLEVLQDTILVHQAILHNACKAAEYTAEWAAEFEKSFSDLSKPVRERHMEFYMSAGRYYSSCRNCSGAFEKSRQMFARYANYLEDGDASLKNPASDSKLQENGKINEYILLQILIGQSYEDEANPDAAKQKYQELLAKIQIWKNIIEKSAQSQNTANVSANQPNANSTVTNSNSNVAAANSNWNTAARPANVVSINTNANTSFQRYATISKRLPFYEDYLQIRLAELNFNRNESAARNLLLKNSAASAEQVFGYYISDSTFIPERYALSSKRIGDLFMDSDKAQAARYYQNAVEILEFIKQKPDRYCTSGEYLENYCSLQFIRRNSYDYDNTYKLSGQFYKDYLEALKALRAVKAGEDATFDEKIQKAEQDLQQNAQPNRTVEQSECVFAPVN